MILIKKYLLLIPLFFFLTYQVAGQEPKLSTADKNAVRIFYQAYDSYQNHQFSRALKEIEKAIERDSGFVEAYVLQGDLYADNQQTEQAIQSYYQAIKHSNPVNPRLYYVIGQLQLSIGFYPDAKENFQKYLEYPNLPEPNYSKAKKWYNSCVFGEKQKLNPVPFSPENLGDSINSENDEYINGITSDGQELYFTRWVPKSTVANPEYHDYNEEFYMSLNKDSIWHLARNLGKPINTDGNEGALSISPDGNLLFFAACNREDGYGSCDLYKSNRTADGWSPPENLGEIVNSPQWDSQPTFSSDGKTLYFASKRPGGKGSSDIWKTELKQDGNWSEPVNLGDSVNSVSEEMAPFIHPDNQTLYFSSKGHQGMGGFDLFLSRRSLNGWHKPLNLGYPINTFSDEITLVVNTKGNLAFISTDKLGGKGKQDVYQFRMYQEIRPMMTTYFKGIVYDERTKKRLEADFELIDLKDQKVIAHSKSNRYTGDFLLVLPTDRNYALNVSHPGYLFYSDNFFLSGVSSVEKPFVKDIPMKQIQVGEAVILKNIFFDTDKYTLKEESIIELEKLYLLLLQNPSLKIEISGHTDNIGSEQHNLELSNNRSKAVYEYLVNKQIATSRLTFKGYGFQKPIDSNQTEAGRSNNRRTEFRVVGN
jgi:outer membrane protein OmpA-like peptidoglycan-associated protein/tetratricopeptide (TPR) repeat protein